MRRMRNNNLEFMIAGSSCRPQLWLFSPNTPTLSLRDSEAWPQLSKSWIALSTQRISTWETNCVIHSIEIYPSDCTIHLFNNRGKARPIAIAPPPLPDDCQATQEGALETNNPRWRILRVVCVQIASLGSVWWKRFKWMLRKQES